MNKDKKIVKGRKPKTVEVKIQKKTSTKSTQTVITYSKNQKRDILRLLQLFPLLKPDSLQKFYDKCEGDVLRTIDNLLFLKRYCCALKLIRGKKFRYAQNRVENLNNLPLLSASESSNIEMENLVSQNMLAENLVTTKYAQNNPGSSNMSFPIASTSTENVDNTYKFPDNVMSTNLTQNTTEKSKNMILPSTSTSTNNFEYSCTESTRKNKFPVQKEADLNLPSTSRNTSSSSNNFESYCTQSTSETVHNKEDLSLPSTSGNTSASYETFERFFEQFVSQNKLPECLKKIDSMPNNLKSSGTTGNTEINTNEHSYTRSMSNQTTSRSNGPDELLQEIMNESIYYQSMDTSQDLFFDLAPLETAAIIDNNYENLPTDSHAHPHVQDCDGLEPTLSSESTVAKSLKDSLDL